MIKITNLLVDMDDVLAAFLDGFEKATGKDIRKLHDPEGWELIGQYSKRGLFRSLKPTKGYEAIRALMIKAHSAGAHVGCLTNVGSPMLYSVDPVIRDKTEWLKEYEVNFPMFWTVSGTGKSTFAHKRSLLIDDSRNNCSFFIKAGGNAVVYDDDKWEDIITDVHSKYQFGSP